MANPKSFKPLRRVKGPGGGVYLKRPDGTRFEVTEVVTDHTDGIEDEDFVFDLGKDWSTDTEDGDSP